MLTLLTLLAFALTPPPAASGVVWVPLTQAGVSMVEGVETGEAPVPGDLAAVPAALWGADADHLHVAVGLAEGVDPALTGLVVLVERDGDEVADFALVRGPDATELQLVPTSGVAGVAGALPLGEATSTGFAQVVMPGEDVPFEGTTLVLSVSRAALAADHEVTVATPLRLALFTLGGEQVLDVLGCVELCDTLALAAADAFTFDGDGDGILSNLELSVGADPEGLDSDGDGIPDRNDGFADPDEDGYPALVDTDADDDGLLDGREGFEDIDGDNKGNHVDDDADGDGRLDVDEGAGDDDCDGRANFVDRVDDDGFCDTDLPIPDVDPNFEDEDVDVVPARPEDFTGCGCAHGGPAGSLLGASLLLLGLGRRRS